MICSNCGKEVSEKAKFCGGCGQPIAKENASTCTLEKTETKNIQHQTAIKNIAEQSEQVQVHNVDTSRCLICGKRFGISRPRMHVTEVKDADWNFVQQISPEHDEICLDCKMVLTEIGKIKSGESVNIDFFHEKKARDFFEGIKKIENSELRGEFETGLRDIIMKIYAYDNYEKIVQDSINKVNNELHELHEKNVINVTMSSIGSDEDNLYILPYNLSFLDELANIRKNKYPADQSIEIGLELHNAVLEQECSYTVIPKNDIMFFQEKGDIQYSTLVSGGGGGQKKSFSFGGAVAGKLLFGNVGAIIGSRAGTKAKFDEIRTDVQEHDNRVIVLKYKDNMDQIKESIYPYDYYDVFMQLIPEKEYYTVNISVKENTPDNTEINTFSKKTENISASFDMKRFDMVREYKRLLDEGIISEEEYERKRIELLEL